MGLNFNQVHEFETFDNLKYAFFFGNNAIYKLLVFFNLVFKHIYRKILNGTGNKGFDMRNLCLL